MPRAPRTFHCEPTVFAPTLRTAMNRPGQQLRIELFVTAATKSDAAALISKDIASVHETSLRLASGNVVDALTTAGIVQPNRAIFVREGGGDRAVWILDPGQPPAPAGELTYNRVDYGSMFVPGVSRFCGFGSVVATADHVWIKTGERGTAWSGVSGPCTQILSTDDDIQALLDSGTATILRAGTGGPR